MPNVRAVLVAPLLWLSGYLVTLAVPVVDARATPAGVPSQDRAATSAHAVKRLPGFLEPEERPDSALLVPAPPRKGSAAYAADLETHRALRALRDTPRWQLAIEDANVQFPHAAATFTCALGLPVTADATPNLYVLLQRAMVDAGQATSRAKDRFQRPRPFEVLDAPMCVPEDASALRKSPAYPSGHAAAGWAWALILAEIAPDRAGPVLRRGYEFGLSRAVCGVHWLSDVETGRTVGAATVARLHADPEFMALLELAREEIARARVTLPPQAPACSAEARALEATATR